MLADLVNRHDVRVVEVGGGFRLGVEALHVTRRRQLLGEDHLEGDDPVEALLSCLVDDAHAAAGDLLQQLVIAEVPDPRPRRRRGFGGQRRRFSRRGPGRFGHPLGQPCQLILVGEEGGQLTGELWVLPQQGVAVGRLAGVHRFQVRVQDRFEPAVPGRVAGWGVHGFLRVMVPIRLPNGTSQRPCPWQGSPVPGRKAPRAAQLSASGPDFFLQERPGWSPTPAAWPTGDAVRWPAVRLSESLSGKGWLEPRRGGGW
jgi:hypothetical protein